MAHLRCLSCMFFRTGTYSWSYRTVFR